jgi:hypothetical protein
MEQSDANIANHRPVWTPHCDARIDFAEEASRNGACTVSNQSGSHPHRGDFLSKLVDYRATGQHSFSLQRSSAAKFLSSLFDIDDEHRGSPGSPSIFPAPLFVIGASLLLARTRGLFFFRASFQLQHPAKDDCRSSHLSLSSELQVLKLNTV